MKKEFSAKRSLMMLAFITAVSMNANAQLGNLINKAKQKVKNKVENVVSDNSGSSSTSNVKSKVTEKASGAAARKLAVKKFGEAPELPEIMAMKPKGAEMDATDMTIKNFVWNLRTTPVDDVKKLAEKLTARAKWNHSVCKAMEDGSIPNEYEFKAELEGQLANWECLYGNLIHVVTLHNSCEMKRDGNGWYTQDNSYLMSCTSASGVEASRKGLENIKGPFLFMRLNNKGQFVNTSRQPRLLEPEEVAATKRDYNMMLNAAWLLEGYPVEWCQQNSTRDRKDWYAINHQRALQYVMLLNEAISNNSPGNLVYKPMPKAGSLNASLKAAALKIAKQQNSNVVNVVITRSAWDVKKNALGVPICRVAYGYRIIQTKNGKQAVSCSWAQDYQGGGKYGSLRHYGVGTEAFYVK